MGSGNWVEFWKQVFRHQKKFQNLSWMTHGQEYYLLNILYIYICIFHFSGAQMEPQLWNQP